MDIFKVSNGPWEKLFEGAFEEKHELRVYSNDKSLLLVVIFEKQNNEVSGAIVEIYKVFFAKGELESFVESLPRELVLLTKHSEKETLKFLLMGSSPVYVDWKEEQFIQETERLLKKIDTSSEILTDVSKAYDIGLEELSNSKSNIKKAFFSIPLLVPIVSSNYQDASTLSETMPVSFHEFFVGMTKQRTKIIEPITLFSKTLVMNGTEDERHHALHLLSEAYLLSGAPVIIFDFENSFHGLKSPMANPEELKKYEIESEPIGFPVRVFSPINDLKIDLALIDPFGFGQAFGFGKSKSIEILASFMMKEKATGIKEFVSKLKELPSSETSEYEVNRTVRIFLLLNTMYPGFFDGHNSAQELATKKVKAIGRGAILEFSGLDERSRLSLSHNVLTSLLDYFKNTQEPAGLKAVIVVPEIKNIFNEKISSVLSQDNLSKLTQCEKLGIGYVISSESEIDFPEGLVSNSEAQISFVKANDCAVQLKGRKSYRVFLRPTLSTMNASQAQADAENKKR